MAKKKIRRIRRPFSFMTFLGVILFFALALFLVWCWLTLNQDRIVANNRRSRAEEAAAKGNYDESAELLKESYEVTHSDSAVSAAYTRCAAYAVYGGYYEQAEEFLAKGRELLGTNKDLEETQDQMYCVWADFHMRHGAYESAVMVLQDGLKTVSGKKMQEMLENITVNRDEAEISSRFQLLAEQLQKYLTVRDFAGALAEADCQDLRNIAQRMKNNDIAGPIIVETSGLRAGLYRTKEGGAVIYYGDYAGDQREGRGTLIGINLYSNTTGLTYQKYYADGAWAADKPQGDQTEYCTYTYGINNYELYRSGSTEQGLWNGIVRSWFAAKPDIIYEPVYENGVPKVIRTSKETGRDNVIAENATDHSTLGISDDLVGKKAGIIGFGD